MNPDGSIRVAHFSDLHYGPKNLAEAERCFGDAIDQAIALRAQAAVISGDATDHAMDLHAPAAATAGCADSAPGRSLPGIDAAGHLFARTAGNARDLQIAGRSPWRSCRGSDRTGRTDVGRSLDCVRRVALRLAAARPVGTVQLRAEREQGGDRRDSRRGGRRAGGGGTAERAAAGVCISASCSASGWSTEPGRVAWNGLRLPVRAWRADGRLRPRVHHRRAVRGRGAGLPAGPYPPSSGMAARRAGGAAVHRLPGFHRAVPPRGRGRQGVPALAGRAPTARTARCTRHLHAARSTSASRASPKWRRCVRRLPGRTW